MQNKGVSIAANFENDSHFKPSPTSLGNIGALALTVPVHPLPTNVASKHWSEPLAPETHRLMAKINTALEQKVLDISQ